MSRFLPSHCRHTDVHSCGNTLLIKTWWKEAVNKLRLLLRKLVYIYIYILHISSIQKNLNKRKNPQQNKNTSPGLNHCREIQVCPSEIVTIRRKDVAESSHRSCHHTLPAVFHTLSSSPPRDATLTATRYFFCTCWHKFTTCHQKVHRSCVNPFWMTFP